MKKFESIVNSIFLSIILLFVAFCSPARADLNAGQCADSIIARVSTVNSGVIPTRLKPFWQAICQGLIDHVRIEMQINLQTGDILTNSSDGPLPNQAGLIPGGRIR